MKVRRIPSGNRAESYDSRHYNRPKTCIIKVCSGQWKVDVIDPTKNSPFYRKIESHEFIRGSMSKIASPMRFERTTYRLGVDPIRWNQVQHSARKSLEIQGFSLFQILSGITLHKHFHRDFTPSDWLEISKAFDFWWTLQVQANSSM